MVESVRSKDAAAAHPSSTASAHVTAARHATAVAFIGSGVFFASWVSRIPQIRAELQLTAADLGIVLLALAVGSLLALPAAAVLIRRFGTRVVVSAMTLVTAAAMTVIGVGYHAGTGPVVVGLFLMGFGLAASNVSMNVQGAAVERRSGRAIMSRFHAGFSVGTVGSALLAAGLIAVGVPVTAHLTMVAVVVAVCRPRCGPGVPSRRHPPGRRARRTTGGRRPPPPDDGPADAADRGSGSRVCVRRRRRQRLDRGCARRRLSTPRPRWPRSATQRSWQL